MTKTRYKIGEVAQKFAISIRLLRYYDSIDLLPPMFKDENGYRYYNASDIVKLEQILLLQMLNFSLQEIKQLFVSDNITDELMVQEEFISNKIKYLSQIKGVFMSVHEKNSELEKMAKEHGMTVDEFKEKSGLKFNEDGSHSLENHTPEMFSKNYSEAELKDLAKQHDMSVKDIKKHIDGMKQHHK